MKIRFNLTVEDYYDYIGSNPCKSLIDRVKQSLPRQLEKGYNMKFKVLKINSWNKWYRVHITADINEETLNQMLSDNVIYMHKFSDLSYKSLHRNPNKKVS